MRFFIISFALPVLIHIALAQVRFINPQIQSPLYPSNQYTPAYRGLQVIEEEKIEIKQHNVNLNQPHVTTVRLYGDSTLGYYYVNLFFGSNYQKESLIVDTGSSITAIPCTKCGNNCGKNHFNRPFDPSKSTTASVFGEDESFGDYRCRYGGEQCTWSIAYTEGSSYRGTYMKDYITYGNELEDYETKKSELANYTEIAEQRKVKAVFGCIERETKYFYEQQADGILGLGINTKWDGHPPNFIQSYQINNQSVPDIFSLCYSLHGGYMSIGGYNYAHHLPNDTVKYVPYHAEYNQYRVHLHRIQFKGKDLNLGEEFLNKGQGAFFDSGTTLTYLNPEVYAVVTKAIDSYCRESIDNCGRNQKKGTCWVYDRTAFSSLQEFFDSFPSFTFYFGDDEKIENHVPYELRGEDYLFQEQAGSNEWCMGIMKYGDRTILGGTFMRNHDILFDREHNRIGWVRANCGAVAKETFPHYRDEPGNITIPDKTDFNKTNTSIITNKTIETPISNDTPAKEFTPLDILKNIGVIFILIISAMLIYRYLRRKREDYQEVSDIEARPRSPSIETLDAPAFKPLPEEQHTHELQEYHTESENPLE